MENGNGFASVDAPLYMTDSSRVVIKCDNCQYVGPGERGRSIWARILAWLCFPIITILYYSFASRRYKCPKCHSTSLEFKYTNETAYTHQNGVKRYVPILLWVLLAVWILMAVIASATSQTDKSALIQIDFKHLSSEQIVSDINQLPSDEQTLAYKEHSALVRQVENIWAQNLQGKDFQSAEDKTVPTLISDGWTDVSARDFISWMLSEAYVVDSENPGSWCKGSDCTAQTDEQIKSSLSQQGLSDNVINGIFQEISVAPSMTP